MKRMVVALAATMTMAAGCESTQHTAVHYFSSQVSCPESRIQITETPAASAVAAVPPEDVRHDPERLAVWTKTQDERHDRQAEVDLRFDHWNVTGCGHALELVCFTHRRHVGDPVLPPYASCQPADLSSLASVLLSGR